MTKENTASTKISGIASFANAFNAFYLIREDQQTLQAQKLSNNDWQTIALEEIPAPGSLARIVLLIPDKETVFRQQSFSADLVTEKNLAEAISLNIESWSPYEPNSPQLSIYKKIQGQWTVATWLWRKTTQERLLNAQPEQQYTHIMPELAWHCARASNAKPTLLIAPSADKIAYIYMAEELPTQITWPENNIEATRFWRGLGANSSAIKHITLADKKLSDTPLGLPEHLKKITLNKATARAKWLKHAQCEGINDWFNPANWINPTLIILSLVLAWGIVDAILITQKNQQIEQLISQSRLSNQDVISQQEKIEQSLEQLTHYAQLKQQQQQAERVFAELSERIPNDIWLEAVQLDQRWLDIRGRGKNIIRLMALLETLQDAEDIVLLNDVRADARTGDEQFQIRIVFPELNATEPES